MAEVARQLEAGAEAEGLVLTAVQIQRLEGARDAARTAALAAAAEAREVAALEVRLREAEAVLAGQGRSRTAALARCWTAMPPTACKGHMPPRGPRWTRPMRPCARRWTGCISRVRILARCPRAPCRCKRRRRWPSGTPRPCATGRRHRRPRASIGACRRGESPDCPQHGAGGPDRRCRGAGETRRPRCAVGGPPCGVECRDRRAVRAGDGTVGRGVRCAAGPCAGIGGSAGGRAGADTGRDAGGAGRAGGGRRAKPD